MSGTEKYPCKKIGHSSYSYRGYTITRHGYYHPDHCIWWEAVDNTTGCGDFHEHTKRAIKSAIDKALEQEVSGVKHVS